MLPQTASGLPAHEQQLLTLACPSEDDLRFFSYCMTVALARGMTRTEALQYVIQCRQTTITHW